MSRGSGTYHQEVAEQKRAAIVAAATTLFLEFGYAGTSLAKIADAAGVSKATLFKQFPTKDALFEAIVLASWGSTDEDEPVPVDDLADGLRQLGERYVSLIGRDEMVSLHRIVIAEMPRLPELSRAQFELGKLPFFNQVERYLAEADAAGTARVDDPSLAATQFLGMIANYALWPRLLIATWDPRGSDTARAVDEAVVTAVARYGA